MDRIRKGIHVLDADPGRQTYFTDLFGDLVGDLVSELCFSSGEEKDIAKMIDGERVPAIILAPCSQIATGNLMERFQVRGWSPTVFCYDERPTFELVMACFDRGVVDVFAIPTSSAVLRVKAYRLLCDGLIARDELESIPELTMKEYRIVRALGSAPGGRLARSGLVRSIWPDLSVSPKTIDVHVFNLRRKLRRHGFDIVTQLEDGRTFSLQRMPRATPSRLLRGDSLS